MKPFCFTKRDRITKKKELDHIFSTAWRISDPFLHLYVQRNAYSYCRLGISVPRKFGGAVKRNKIKRLIRESFRQMKPDLPQGLDLVFMPRSNNIPQYTQIQRSMEKLIKKSLARLGK